MRRCFPPFLFDTSQFLTIIGNPLGRDLASYSSALIDVGLARLPPADDPIHKQPLYQGSVSEHLEFLRLSQALFPKLIQNPQI